MNNDSESLSLIILAFVAGFIILQLRRTLGRRDGYDGKDEKKQNNPFKDNRPDRSRNDENVIPIRSGLNDENEKPAPEPAFDVGVKKTSPFYGTLEKICKFDRSFTLPLFIDGAEYAYGMILNAFWTGDSKTLKTFLNRDVFGQFEDAIKSMKDDGKTFENKLEDVEKIELIDASIQGSMAELTVKYSSHMTIVIKDEDGNVVEGDPEKVVPIVDVWTFCRDVKRNDPNWTLVSTSEA
ncbi:Tim44/TimA family putative adaptor protein [Pseudemcibacter aquimaris]|uniref:Tim44/TimA family putative adaptor protein n=1 Tax=Pseudemcibacter aquimaris TaxID=2857064 RepID=UPI002012E9C7|nr:Tim44/TimA family putative adaptor protein [Pseudemcibacter aquimaris]MCC3861821.1 Tim44/TimA family putative adaptor protein [Pseudemcibacter aquimaris]WDU58576.1 Tim44/TimA family putative adaptor protein [Pseudemcibacter aquimaris]